MWNYEVVPLSALEDWGTLSKGVVTTQLGVRDKTNDIRTMRQRERDDPSEVLREFVKENPGVATAFVEGGSAPQGAA